MTYKTVSDPDSSIVLGKIKAAIETKGTKFVLLIDNGENCACYSNIECMGCRAELALSAAEDMASRHENGSPVHQQKH